MDGAYFPAPNPTPVRTHFKMLHELAASSGVNGVLILASYGENPVTGVKINPLVMRFGIGDVDGMTDAAVALCQQPHRNVYAPWSILRSDVDNGKRGGLADVRAVLALVVDQDADPGKAGKGRLPMLPPYMVRSSADNLQPVYPLARALTVPEAQPIAEALAALVGGDEGTRDLAHIWRVAGTLNWPTRSKIARGRPLEPQLVTVAIPWSSGELIDADALADACAKASKSTRNGANANGANANGNGNGPKIDTGGASFSEAGVEEVREALTWINPDLDYEDWVRVLMALHAGLGDAALPLAVNWSSEGSKFVDGEVDAKWRGFKAGGGAKLATVFHFAQMGGCDISALARKHRGAAGAGPRGAAGARPGGNGAGPDVEPEPEASAPLCLAPSDFVSLMSPRSYVFLPTRDHWVATAVNARVRPVSDGNSDPVAASVWLDRNRPVEQATWSPGEPLLIKDRLIAEGGWIQRPGCTVLNLYRPPAIVPRSGDASPWLDHVRRVYPDDADHLIKWFAMRVQHSEEKINHSVVLGGEQGIGKDTLLEPVKRAVGPWNVAEVSPQQLLGRFNGFLKSVLICINETRDLGDFDRFAFYDHLKAYTVTPPNVLRIDEKNLREYSILNLCGIVQTTNHKTDGIYLPPGDRRTYVAWSDAAPGDFDDGYWQTMYRWFDNGGAEIVAGYLHDVDLSTFDPKAPPPKTPAFWEIVNASQAPENSEMADALEKCGWPKAVTLNQVKVLASAEFGEWLTDRRNARRIPHRLEECGYIIVRSPDNEDGRWRVDGRKQMVYANKKLSPAMRLQAAADLAGDRL